MWQALFRISNSVLTKRFDLLDLVFFSLGFLITGVNLGLDKPLWFILTTQAALAVLYLMIAALVMYVHSICFGRITNTDPFYGGTE